MNFWDLIFNIIEKYFEFNKQIPIPGFDGVSLFDLKVALFITGIVICGLISVVPNTAYSVGEGVSERRQKRKAAKEKKAQAEAKERELAQANAEFLDSFGD